MTGLTDADRQLLASFAAHDEHLRSGLCTIARYGVWLRQDDPERAEALAGQLESHPFYKGGQTLFDLLEVEDFMLDGCPPELNWKAAVDVGARLGLPIGGAPPGTELPALEAGFYLYRDVVIGLIGLLSASLGKFSAIQG